MSEESFISSQECQSLSTAMDRKYSSYLNGRWFEVHAEERDGGVYAKVLLRNENDSFHYPVEARMMHREEDLEKHAAALFLIDFIDLYFEEYLTEDDNLFVSIDWNDHEYDTVKFQMRGQVLNLDLEHAGDAILGRREI